MFQRLSTKADFFIKCEHGLLHILKCVIVKCLKDSITFKLKKKKLKSSWKQHLNNIIL